MDETYTSRSFGSGPSVFHNELWVPSSMLLFVRTRIDRYLTYFFIDLSTWNRKRRDQGSSSSKITYKGYLLKRSNRPFSGDPEAFRLRLSKNSALCSPMDNNSVADCESMKGDAAIASPQHQRLPLPHPVEPSVDSSYRISENDPLEWAMDSVAAFFGLPKRPQQAMRNPYRAPTQIQCFHRNQTTAIPILGSQGDDSFGSIQSLHHDSMFQRHSTPVFQYPERAPPDFVDQHDGHIWRAKYCVLQDGILYFYQNMAAGESEDAVQERNEDSYSQNSSNGVQFDNEYTKEAKVMTKHISVLSQSPVTRNPFMPSDPDEGRHHLTYRWEKRVVLDCVGSVRSAELEYGPNSFELHSIINDEESEKPVDTLILGARDQASMKEWMYQFHRSLASFVREMVGTVGGGSERMQILRSRNYRMSHSMPIPRTLSHGHGRMTEHRHREMEASGSLPIDSDFDLPSNDSQVPCAAHVYGGGNGMLIPPGKIEAKEPNQEKPLKSQSEIKKQNGMSVKHKYVPLNFHQTIQPESGTIPAQVSTPAKARYIPPQLRNPPPVCREQSNTSDEAIASLRQNRELLPLVDKLDILDEECNGSPLHLGGCADPALVDSSIMDAVNIPRKASVVTRSRGEPFGSSRLGREVGAVSERGIRDSNEDAYVIANDLNQTFASRDMISHKASSVGCKDASLFAIFDGHCGNQAARFAAEKLIFFLEKKFHSTTIENPSIASTLYDTIVDLDESFCRICQEGGRDWESGTTALVAILTERSLTIANLGDCRGVVCRIVERKDTLGIDWNVLEGDSQASPIDGDNEGRSCIWREVASVHKPSDEDERIRIEDANGWITTETEIPIGQLRRMDFLDEDVVGILRRCFSDRYEHSGGNVRECRSAPQRILNISRVCGELSVSRAIGDRDFKSAVNQGVQRVNGDVYRPTESVTWDGPPFLAYPEGHSHFFRGSLIENSPDVFQIEMNDPGSLGEFLLFASDGLWVRRTSNTVLLKNYHQVSPVLAV